MSDLRPGDFFFSQANSAAHYIAELCLQILFDNVNAELWGIRNEKLPTTNTFVYISIFSDAILRHPLLIDL